MNQLNSALIVNILQRDYPDIAGRILAQISNALPANKVSDYTCLRLIVDDFKAVTGITDIIWQQQKERIACLLSGDDNRLCKVTEVREMLIAVVLMFFHPERLMGFELTRAKPGLLKALCIELSCGKVVLSNTVSNAIFHYKAYKGFKTEVEYLYSRINLRNDYFTIKNH